MFRPLSALILISGLMTAGCSLQPYSQGEPGGLLVIADELDRPVVRAQIERAFGRIIETPQPEPLFRIDWIDAGQLSARSRSPLMLLAATIDGDGPTAAFLQKMLDANVRAGVESGEYFIFKRRDAWAREQLVLILVGRTRRELGGLAAQWMDTLQSWAFDFELKRNEKRLFKRGEQKALAKQIAVQYGFSLRMQPDYLLAEENDSLQFIRILRHWPDRWLTVMWGASPSPDSLAAGFFFQQRSNRSRFFLDPVSLYEDHWSNRTVVFKNQPALFIQGLWSTLDIAGGGPFFSYCLYNQSTQNYYIIDGAVFAPGEAKMPYLWQLYTLAHTFKFADG